ncbi:HAMP domain-containing histidine kinase [Nordella sp. HKS 07]|uniref:sensor histidine kinase n=1 Tax=Nordella sp. HKS 07 TaxID=2712222 RepID=UPI0013E17B62|nr:HAMP domain-containing sensor histidine kinase [Nordella sp. HKS 07]QIG50674.1 HAMP domain-containing histidine kinase [Nordella sp. HKS 07]
MTGPARRSLRRRLFRRLLAVQAAVLALVIAVLFGSGLLFDFRSPDATIDILRAAIGRDENGRLRLRETEELKALRVTIPDLWFIIRDRQQHKLAHGAIPPEYANIGTALDDIGQARLGWNLGDPDRPTARVRWAETSIGRLQFTTGSEAPWPFHFVLLGLSLVTLQYLLPILAVMAVGALIATPWILRSAFAGLDRAASEADTIDVSQRGLRLATVDIPSEVLPFVNAVNGALARLDEGYERQERFLADAAHELRTPIAILNTRLAALPQGPAKAQLALDAARLRIITEQMLDLERLHSAPSPFPDVDLEALARQVILDMGPLAFEAGYEIEFGAADGPAIVKGDAQAIGRALTNLVQNAIDHGGRKGTISLLVGTDWVEVTDEGPGIPSDLRDRIFEPFFKRKKDGRGAGLGLSLVGDAMRLHGGGVSVRDRAVGASFRLSFPLARDAKKWAPVFHEDPALTYENRSRL